MNTKPCMSSHNKRIIILIYTKDCSDTEGYKSKRISWPKKWPPARFWARNALTGHSSFKKASKRLYFLLQLKRAKVTRKDLGLFYISCIRSVLDYAVPGFHYSIPKYIMHELERVQKKAISIIWPVLNYHDVLNRMNIKKLVVRHNDICNTLFSNIQSDKDHRLHNLLLAPYETTYSLMHACATF